MPIPAAPPTPAGPTAVQREMGDWLVRDLCSAPFNMRKEDAIAAVKAALPRDGDTYEAALARVLATMSRARHA